MKNRFSKYLSGASRRKRGLAIGLLALLLVLLGARVLAPSLIRNHVNGVLSDLDGYNGSIEDIDLSLIRGAYRVDGLILNKEHGGAEQPFLEVRSMDLSVEWLALFKGALVGELVLEEPKLSLVVSDRKEREQLGDEGNWVETVQALFPFTLNRFEVKDGAVDWALEEDSPLGAVAVRKLNGVASDITNVDRKQGEALPSQVRASGLLGEGAPMELEGSFDLLAESLEMNLDFQCESIHLPYLNPILENYANIDVRSGTLGIFVEWAVSSGEVDGYVKFLARDIDVFQLGKEGGNPLSALWDAFAGFLITITENRSKDQFAAKVPFKGKTSDLKAGVLPTIGSLLQNAFVRALEGDVDGSVSLADLQAEGD
ncbi:DUF748 domain-containing protein [Pelagicoccus sp. SDUM812005]|uniref:DUF748 domain-containing protein n=1 Tax=Pelagicoccus sp. SDUM812005 TaxID=3041257 RepID=UPI00280ECDD9|nr:DUF748 domain-containing protein [Pelagicoccus sp. SDUM812005]MDQ8181056.1 DUF748 domain-containing protein [Pelagicoccus sp. SDUM812005]